MSLIDGYFNYVPPTFDNNSVVISSDGETEEKNNASSLKDALQLLVKYAAQLEVAEEEQRKEAGEISNKNGD